MPIERKKIEKRYLILCEGADAQYFLINYLNSNILAKNPKISQDIQVFDFGGNNDLLNFLMNLKNMDKFDQVTSLGIIRDAEKDYAKACREVSGSLRKSGFEVPKQSGMWTSDDKGLRVGFMLFPLNNADGTLEDLCLRILSEKNKDILAAIDSFLAKMEDTYGRKYNRKHKNQLHTYLASSEKFVAMQLGTAAKSGAFEWDSDELEPLKKFLTDGFDMEK